MKRARFTAEAREEFLLEIKYYNAERSGLGKRFSQAVEKTVARAIAFPLTGSSMPRNTRRMFVEHFPFSIVYRADDDGIVVFAVVHHRRHPNYWRSRIQEA